MAKHICYLLGMVIPKLCEAVSVINASENRLEMSSKWRKVGGYSAGV